MYTTGNKRLSKQTLKNEGLKTEIVERQSLIQILYKPLNKIKKLTKEQLDKVIELCPKLKGIYNIVGSFRELVSSRDADKLTKWIDEAKVLGIDGINSFVNGIIRDINAVKNAIIYDYNNGLAEGSVNKLKVVKRIMYGRSSFDLLRKKVLRLEKSK